VKRAIAATPRPLDDYRDIFLLEEEEFITSHILDCGSGASPFGAQVRARDGSVVSVDPLYAHAANDLQAIVFDDLAHVARWTRERRECFDWSNFGSPRMFERYLILAAELFLADYRLNTAHYVAAGLPALPFPDGAFNLSLCSHYLFCSANYLSYAETLSAIRELLRVTHGEVRIYPLTSIEGAAYPELDELRTQLSADGYTSELRPSRFRFVPGAGDMLVLTAPGSRM
jgi:hypothetical protein